MSERRQASRVSSYMRVLDIAESRIEEEPPEGLCDTLDSQRTVQAEVQEAIADDNDALFYIDNDVEGVITGGFQNVAIYITEKLEGHIGRRFRWLDTELVGTLELTVRGEFEGLPLAKIKVYRSESSQEESDIIFEYELPINFKHDCEMSPVFYAVQGINEQYFGFHFENPLDKHALVNKMKQLCKVLERNKYQVRNLKRHIAQADLTIDQINYSTDRVVEILDRKGHEERLGEIYDLLVKEGLDQDIIEIVMHRVGGVPLEKQSSYAPIDENGILFESRLARFDAIPQE